MKRARCMEPRITAVVFGTCASLACSVPALAVDRSLGADVPKPAVTGTPWTDAEIAALDAGVDLALAGAKTLRGAHVGIYVIDARDGRVLYERNGDDAFAPASTFKLLVGSAALERLGPQFRFRTDVVADGPVENGVLQGSLVLRGGGDPFLSAADLEAAAEAVAKAGITGSKDVVIDDAHFETPGYLPGWSWDDFPYYYAPVVSALSLERNVVHLTIAPGAAAGAPARVTAAPIGHVGFPVEGCEIATVAVRIVPAVTTAPASGKNTVDLVRRRSGCITVTGTVPLGATPDDVDAAVPSPAAYAHDVFADALERRGVHLLRAIGGHAEWPRLEEHRLAWSRLPNAKVVWAHDSEPLGDVLADMWLASDNLAAELLLRELGFAQDGAPGTTEHGVAVEKTWLKQLGVDTDALALEDGSGLSVYDRITPRDLVVILKHDWDGPNRDLILDDLPIAGVRGTLKSSFTGTPAEKHVFAKTGTLSHVSALAGYVANAKHGAVIFAFQVDDWVGASADLRELRGRVLSQFVER
jgi:D-alanyl-D-alanine carboxypeptidase/D-alanyl-D-alanine-endopeptidase (penicillin-binding protein 4)